MTYIKPIKTITIILNRDAYLRSLRKGQAELYTERDQKASLKADPCCASDVLCTVLS